MPVRHSRESVGDKKRWKEEKVVQRTIFLPRTDAIHQSRLLKTVVYGTSRGTDGGWPGHPQITHWEVGRAATGAMLRKCDSEPNSWHCRTVRAFRAVGIADAPPWRSNPVAEVARHDVHKEYGRHAS